MDYNSEPAQQQGARLQLWGGVECSVVRIRERWRDQVRETGHHDRVGDLDAIANLGIRTLRYPVLWERCVPGPAHVGWAWHDERLDRLRTLGITPIVGLLHHGAGPPGTNPLDPHWPEALAAHAAETARRYPWVKHWTPVNEPLTTARFSTLYGYWFPHATDKAAFDMMVVNQCRAVLLAMRAIREHVPDAQLIQTEDLGRVFSTASMRDQAEHDNQLRWLSLDLLCGLVGHTHPARRSLIDNGIAPAVLDEFQGGDAAPDVIGVNHYVTSDRFLDDRINLHMVQARGPSHRAYIDIEATRMDVPSELLGWKPRLREAWQRYRRPLAITEAHLCCKEDVEPVRWLLDAWHGAEALRAEGADVQAVTAWSLFGAVDWDSMLRRNRRRYEPGLWNARRDPPRPTRLALAAASLAQTGQFTDPALPEQGWWRRQDRLHAAARAEPLYPATPP